MKTVNPYDFFARISKKTSVKVFFCLCVILCMAFIFSRSLKVADASDEESGRIVNMTADTLEKITKMSVVEKDTMSHKIRKTAHFVEFMVLGMLTLIAFALLLGKRIYSCIAAFAFSFSTACADEFLQTFTEGRSGSFKDALIDVSGSLTGIIIISLAFIIIRALHRKNHISKETL